MQTNTNLRLVTRTGLLLALTLVVQMMGFPQPVTGPLVNFFLFIAVILVGIGGGTAIGVLTPWIALSRGILPPPLAPMVPFIILGNLSQVLLFGLLKKVNRYLAVLVAAGVKYLILVSGVRFFVQIPPMVAKAMQTPQLVTALVGGVFALIVAELLKERLSLTQGNPT